MHVKSDVTLLETIVSSESSVISLTLLAKSWEFVMVLSVTDQKS